MPIKLLSSEAHKILGDKLSFSMKTNKRGCVLRSPDNHANRGMEFERLINEANEVYRQKGIAVFTKIPTEFIPIRRNGQMVGAKVTHKSVADYIGVFKGIPVAIEAKSTNQKRISYNDVKPHQEKFLNDWVRTGGRAFVIVSFGLERFFLVPWDYWGTCIACWEHRGNPDQKYDNILLEGISFPINRKASISADEVPIQFEVRLNKQNGVLDYICGVEVKT